jgi:TolB-like protein/Tfp pilus assembly protein PilF
MFTDMVGYTASMQTDEAGSLKLLREQEELVRPLFVAHRGREIKSTGDGFLVEFDSALQATQCAIDIQHRLHERNSQTGVAAIQLRIGVHLGDVEQHGLDIFGDAVNMASRVEPLAEPGGICISDQVFAQIRNKIPNKLEKIEPKELKNVRLPMEVYRIEMPWTVPVASSWRSAFPRLAILPFASISPDPKDEYIADGLTEELITVLSQLRELRVIARASVSQYKSSPKPIAQVGAELGVRTVLEGSVRKAGNRLRITVQLIDVASQEHSWAKTYDHELEDVFQVQADIARQVAEALRVRVRAAEEERLASRPAVRPESYLAYLKGRTLLHSLSESGLKAAKEQFELAISLDPKNAAAYSGLSDMARILGWRFPRLPRAEWEETSRDLVSRAIALDPNLAEAHASRALIFYDDYDFAAAEQEFKLALSLNPSYPTAHHWYAAVLQEQGHADEALRELSLAHEADPRSIDVPIKHAFQLIWLGRFDEARIKIEELKEVDRSGEAYHFSLARLHLAQSEFDQALQEIDRLNDLRPGDDLAVTCYAEYYALTGQKDRAKELLQRLEAPSEGRPPPGCIAFVYSELNDLDQCFRWLEIERENHLIPLHRLRWDGLFKHVRDDPRYQKLLQKMNLE